MLSKIECKHLNCFCQLILLQGKYATCKSKQTKILTIFHSHEVEEVSQKKIPISQMTTHFKRFSFNFLIPNFHCHTVTRCFFLFLGMNVTLLGVHSYMKLCIFLLWMHWYFKVKNPLRFKDFIKVLIFCTVHRVGLCDGVT